MSWSATEAAQQVAVELERSAVERDRQGSLPVDEVRLLKASGLLKMLVPKAEGGEGASWEQTIAPTTIVAAADSSVGHLLGYHHLNYLSALGAANEAQRTELSRGVSLENWFLGDSVNPLDPRLRVVREADEIVLEGARSFSTGAAVADRILLALRLGDRDFLTLLPRDTAGLRANDDWRNMGQRLTASGSLDFSGVRFNVCHLLGRGPDQPAEPPMHSAISAMIQATLSAVAIGTAQGAFQAAGQYLRDHSRAWFKSGRQRAVDDPLIAASYGVLAARVEAAEALLERTVRRIQIALDEKELTEADRSRVSVDAFGLKIVATETALDVTAKIFELMGARSSSSRLSFDRYWRNARTITLHDSVVYKGHEIGRYLLCGEQPTPSSYS